ncbi:MAG: diacylglycerol/lipid kinase family protein [Lysinibacillus sp.]
MRLVFIINEFAGNGRGRRVWQEMKNGLAVPYDMHVTGYPGHAYRLSCELARQAAEERRYMLLIAIGGDGTIHEVVNGCAHSEYIVLGNMPAGSGNDFARGFQAFRHVSEIEAYMQDAYTKRVDLGEAVYTDQQFFINNCGVGFDAFVGLEANRSEMKKRFNQIGSGKFAYVYYVILGLARFKPFSLSVSCDEKTYLFDRVWFATVSNQPYFGGGMKISPESSINDGKLEITIVHSLSRIKFLFMFMSVFFGAHTRIRGVEQMRGECFALSYDRPLPCHADGEDLYNRSMQLHVRIQKAALKIAKIISS